MNPSLAQVLESGTGSPLPPTLYLIAALATIFFAAVAANTYIRRKNRWMENIVEDCQNNTSVMENLEKQAATEKLEKLEFIVAEMKREKECLLDQNGELSNQLRCTNELKQAYDLLYRSNIALNKECERLKMEKEELTLKASSRSLIRAKHVAIIKRAKKEVVRKPKRVSKTAR
ncbi:hypothetical protein A2311_06105 [candidate division WOR-1 bacterium RIFOXYB2_FULL_48_7]|uniref:Uncharacterized protein n=1 Tax=candidate division WOR-1 bacterium RIFOXYB2_FULL_48_7 TaxID=1802583 RepID=A0A1F4TS52_UNCSA|nr:MAG: hypothetical protein A2311_06105 [candidate division WOR-1 bacterium RIFOXYB2_FULL_48_7]